MADVQVEIEQEDSSGVKVVKVKGTMDKESYPDIEEIVVNLIKAENYHIVIDMAGLEYINSAGWVVFIGKLKDVRDHRGDIKLCCMNDQVSDIFRQLGLDYIINTFGNTEDAIKAFKKAY